MMDVYVQYSRDLDWLLGWHIIKIVLCAHRAISFGFELKKIYWTVPARVLAGYKSMWNCLGVILSIAIASKNCREVP
jgi:hypothetical protein